ncbi:class I adenylate-forming enzyme family protein [Ruegeria halocynthiae]|uniref:class I adenylate-forming enzyme family protein n=1 Tax=Ruegeria halocynthiae TaxID=985054 RepID=UPI00068AD5A0|nr:AMP-binding protein [Ruegeria halocynthiae]
MNRIHQMLEATPASKLAIVDHDNQNYTYGDLISAADTAAGLLRDHGVRGGDRVVVIAENCAAFVSVILALSKLDAWVVLLNARATVQERDNVIEHSGARCVIATTGASRAAGEHATQLGATTLGKLPTGDLVVSPINSSAVVEPVAQDAGQVAALLYTSGTSGQPKGVMLTHDNLIFTINICNEVGGFNKDDHTLVVLPGTHVYSFSNVILAQLAVGASLRFLTRFDPAEVVEELKSDVTFFPAVPQMFAQILKVLKEQGITKVDGDLRFFASGGSPLDPSWQTQIEEIFGVGIYDGYGLTEASPTVTTVRLDKPTDEGTVGQPLPGLDVQLRNASKDGVGELQVRGRSIMKGYYHNLEATAEAVTEDGFLCTGDLARIAEDGSVFIVGRCKELIIHSGFNVYPPEVETALNALPAVVQAAVVGRAREGNEDVLAFVTVNAEVTGTDLKEQLKETLVRYKIPQHIVVTAELPQAATGKILKNKLVTVFAEELRTLDEAVH